MNCICCSLMELSSHSLRLTTSINVLGMSVTFSVPCPVVRIKVGRAFLWGLTSFTVCSFARNHAPPRPYHLVVGKCVVFRHVPVRSYQNLYGRGIMSCFFGSRATCFINGNQSVRPVLRVVVTVCVFKVGDLLLPRKSLISVVVLSPSSLGMHCRGSLQQYLYLHRKQQYCYHLLHVHGQCSLMLLVHLPSHL